MIGSCHGPGVQSLAYHPETHLQSQTVPCRVYGGKSGTGKGFSPNTAVFSCQYLSTNVPYPPIYHRRCIVSSSDSTVK